MHHPVWTTTPDEPLRCALKKMERHDIGCLPVLDDQRRPMALLQRRDLVALLAGQQARETRIAA